VKYAVIFLGFAIGQGLLVNAGASDGYFVGLWVMAIVTGFLAFVSPRFDG
jgi:hypothetical protein